MPATYVLHLIALECLRAQELDGDEIYLRLNGEEVWALDRHAHMSQNPEQARCYNIMDFASGRRQGAAGWEPIPSFAADSLSWSFSGEAVVEIYEADTFSGDDLIGRQHVTGKDADRGLITAHYEREGAHYALSYRVEQG